MGIDVLCGDVSYRSPYSCFMVIRVIACWATRLYLLDLKTKPPAERAKNILALLSYAEEDDPDLDLDKESSELIDAGVKVIDDMTTDKNCFARAVIDTTSSAAFLFHQSDLLANLRVSGVVNFVFRSDSQGYFPLGMATDILAWWSRVEPFYRAAAEEFVGVRKSKEELQKETDSLAKRAHLDPSVVVKADEDRKIVENYMEAMHDLIKVLREVVSTETYASVC